MKLLWVGLALAMLGGCSDVQTQAFVTHAFGGLTPTEQLQARCEATPGYRWDAAKEFGYQCNELPEHRRQWFADCKSRSGYPTFWYGSVQCADRPNVAETETCRQVFGQHVNCDDPRWQRVASKISLECASMVGGGPISFDTISYMSCTNYFATQERS